MKAVKLDQPDCLHWTASWAFYHEEDFGCFAKKTSIPRKLYCWSKGDLEWLNIQKYLQTLTLSYLECECPLHKVHDWAKEICIPQDWSWFGCMLASISCLVAMSWKHCRHLARLPRAQRDRQEHQQCRAGDTQVVRSAHLLQIMIIFIIL